MSKTWFITGAGRGLGKEFARAALGRGDRVAATARNTAALDDLVDSYGDLVLPLQLDVTDRTAVREALAHTVARFDRLDVVVNNAGYGLFGTVEEINPEELQAQLDVNLFGALHVTQAAVPIMREQGSGHLIQISTIGAVVSFPNLGGYNASKWALEGLSEALAMEVAPFGISVTMIEPGSYATEWAGNSAAHATPLPVYDELRATVNAQWAATPPEYTGDPVAAGAAVLKVVDAEQPPLRIFFGTGPTMMAPQVYQERLATWERWKSLSIEANGR